MKIISLRRDFIKVLVETPEDLIILDSILKEGDIIGGKTVRVIKYDKHQEKRPIYLKIYVEKKKFTENSLRITGKILEGPEEVSKGYHTIEVKEGSFLDIFKKVDDFVIKKIRESERFKKKIIVITLDYGKISIFEVTNYNIKEIFEKVFQVPGKNQPKEREKALEEFFKFVNRKIEEIEKNEKYVVIIGNKFILEKINAKRKIESPHYGIVAVKELFKRKEMLDIIGDMDLAKAEEIFEEFMKRLVKEDNRIAYGIKEIEEKAKEGRVDVAVFTRDILKEKLELIKEIEEKGGRVYLVDERTEIGVKVKNFDRGIALLRW